MDEHREWKDANPLRAWRTAHRVSMMDTAARLQSSMSALQQWEAGATTPSIEKMQAIAAMLDVPVSTIVARWQKWAKRRPGIAA